MYGDLFVFVSSVICICSDLYKNDVCSLIKLFYTKATVK